MNKPGLSAENTHSQLATPPEASGVPSLQETPRRIQTLFERPVSRRGLFQAALGAAALTAEATTLYKTAEVVGFIANAPEYASSPVVTGAIDYGDMSAPAKACASYNRIVLGDSVAWGWVDGRQYCMAGMLADDVNQTLEASGVPIQTKADPWQTTMYAKPGLTTEDVSRQVQNYTDFMSEYRDTFGLWEVEVSMGGNDALNYFSDRFSPQKISSLISGFSEFLTGYKSRCEAILTNIANLKRNPSLSELQRITIDGIPDIGNSTELWYLRLPGVKQVVTAACKYMNQVLVDTAQEVSQKTGVKIWVDDMFGLSMADIHPTKKGYRQAVLRREQRRVGEFPDGKRNFRDETDRQRITHIDPPSLPTEDVPSTN